MKRLVAAMLAVIVAAPATAIGAETGSEETTFEQIGYGTGSVIGSVLYFPLKASFCILGSLGSGVALLIGGTKAAGRVIDVSCRGTWAITPEVVKGQEPVNFVGR
jgi:hypothetical protein